MSLNFCSLFLYYRGYWAVAQPGMGREKGLWIHFLWHVEDWPQLMLGEDHNLTDFSGVWLPYLAHIPWTKLIARYLGCIWGLRFPLCQIDRGWAAFAFLQVMVQGPSARNSPRMFQLMAVLCISSVLFKVMPWSNFRGFLPFVLMVLQLLHGLRDCFMVQDIGGGAGTLRIHLSLMSMPSECDHRELSSMTQRVLSSPIFCLNPCELRQLMWPRFCFIFLFPCCSWILFSLDMCFSICLWDYLTV